ncbi:hypothetical protein [Goekera deserti]|nr:hypothetical protein [Goekera deserti]
MAETPAPQPSARSPWPEPPTGRADTRDTFQLSTQVLGKRCSRTPAR